MSCVLAIAVEDRVGWEMSTEAIERVLRESSYSDADTLATAAAELFAIRRSCRALFVGSASTDEEAVATALLEAIANEDQ
jgi:hypothetical protein